MLFPVEGWRAVVSEQLAGKFCVYAFSKFFRFTQIRFGRFAPEKISVRRVRNCAGDGTFQSRANAEESFTGAVAGQELAVSRIDIAGKQRRAVGIGARHN